VAEPQVIVGQCLVQILSAQSPASDVFKLS